MPSLKRIQEELAALAAIGATSERGVTRLAWSTEERAAHQLVASRMVEAGLDVHVDPVGNSFGQRQGLRGDLGTIMIGSHLDSVQNGGRFDGTLGVVGALEVVRELKERHLTTRHPITVVAFAAEEAARFQDGCLGSRLAMGLLPPDALDLLVDGEGLTATEAMREVGFEPGRTAEIQWAPSRIAAFLELHIEQGHTLERLGKAIGIVTAIAGATRYRATLTGRADHSGARPMGERRDALAAAAEVVLGVEKIASRQPSATTVGTVGILKVQPGVMTVVPGRVELGVDVRDSVLATKRTATDRIEAMVREICERRRIGLELQKLLDQEPTEMSREVRDSIRRASDALGYDCHSMPSAAGHDARGIASVARTGMIFVPSRGGVSHSPDEWTSDQDLLAGVDVLMETVRVVDQEIPF